MIQSLHLQDFRSHQDLRLEDLPHRVAFWGDNGVGKTNVLEAIYTLSQGRSWRESTHPSVLVSAGAPSAKVSIKTQDFQAEMLIVPPKRQFFYEGKKVSLLEWVGRLPTLLFCPEKLTLFAGAKRDRLSHLDRLGAQVSSNFRACLHKAVQAHEQKTALLRDLRDQSLSKAREQLTPWNQILAQNLPFLHQERKKLLQTLQPYFQEAYARISQKDEAVGLELLDSECLIFETEVLLDFFDKNISRELASARNSLSPTRDDVSFFLRGFPVNDTASRGEVRSFFLALLSAEKSWFIHQHNLKPILLLDDVFSELDDHRQHHLHELCEGVQTFFTTTHQEHLREIGEGAKVIHFPRSSRNSM